MYENPTDRCRCNFTPASERALAAARTWTNGNSGELDVPEVLLGLLAEPECSAALLLARCGIDAAAVRAQFPQLSPATTGAAAKPFAKRLVESLDMAEHRLMDYPKPLNLATEHILLGIAWTKNEISARLSERGLDAEALEAEVHRLAGHQPGALPFDFEDVEPQRQPTADAITEPPAHEQLAVLRVIDAAANRAGEGLRVIEDYLRFVLDDRHLTRECKALRHELTSILEVYSSRDSRHAARETQADVGTSVTLDTEETRGDAADVWQANFKRIEQSLRSLEEYSKLSQPAAAAGFEQLRYRAYTLERAVDITRTSLEELADARLYVLVDGGPSPDAFQLLMESLVASRVSVIQLRDKQLADRQLLQRARLLRGLTRDSRTLFIMNDRPDLAVLAEADGVHVGQDELSVKDTRRILGPRGLIGVSTHSIEQARAAVLDGANYIGVGPTFPSGTKQFAEFTGCDLLRQVSVEIRLPAFAIGGITLENLPQVLATGVDRVAVSGAITGAVDPAAASAKLLSTFRANG